MAKTSGGTRKGSSRSPRGLAYGGGNVKNLSEGLKWEQTVQGNTVEYEISRNNRTGNYELRSHEYLSDNYGNSRGTTNDVQEEAKTLEALRRKIRRGGYFENHK